MAAGKPNVPGGISLDDLIALTDEMAALVRAGVPLASGLAALADDLSGSRGQISAEIARRMQAGESLTHILETSRAQFPPSYRAVVEAGVRSGRLTSALEGLATASRRIAELRRLNRAALVYPMTIAFLAFAVFVASLVWLEPRITTTYELMDEPPSAINLLLDRLGQSAPYWAPPIALAAIAAVAVWWYRSTRAASTTWGIRVGPAARLRYYGQIAAFSETLALLVENGVPLAGALTLAADATGNDRFRTAAGDLSAAIHRGSASPTSQIPSSPAQSSFIPPMVGWLIAGENSTALADSLRSAAEAYRQRAIRLDDRLRLYVPIALTIGIGGTAVALYAISMLGPWYQMLTHISFSHP